MSRWTCPPKTATRLREAEPGCTQRPTSITPAPCPACCGYTRHDRATLLLRAATLYRLRQRRRQTPAA